MNPNPLDALVPEVMDAKDWYNVPLGIGVGRNDAVVGVDLRDDPNLIAVGSNRTIALQRIALSALSRGHEVILIDDLNKGSDFTRSDEWLKAIAQTPLEAIDALVRVVGEREDRERLQPLTVIVDSFDSLIVPRESEGVRSRNARINSLYYADRLAGEALVHLVIGVDGLGFTNLPSKLQAKFTGRLLVDRLPPDIMRALFAERTPEVMALIDQYSDTRGLGILDAHDGNVSGVTALQVAPVLSIDVSETLERIGVPKPERWNLKR